ncbi:MAG: hypothetical protein JWQ96_1523, partial [Segetibacter sp.]|nr:hypothetical protein [Segetibacter sp.]
IFVLENGSVIEHGTHQSLLSKNGYYAELYQVQGMESNEEVE